MTTLAEVSREGILLAAGGRALLLQLAHPAIGRGVARHSDFAGDPLGRLHGTLAYVYAIAAGTPGEVAAMRRIVNRAHAPVRGPGYSAMDPELQLWVAATLYDSAIGMYTRVFGEPTDAEALYRSYAVLGGALQMPAELWPADRAAFGRYWDAQLARLAVDDEVRAVERTLLGGATLPVPLRPLLPGVRAVTAALLPGRVREEFRMAWSDRDQARVERRLAVASAAYRRLPLVVRSAPQRHYLRRVAALARR
ncbi:oxygenase MpaB family protein [Galbitalea sp. SE-J8]|uniref:oxygenase MpaB family protein n=1 Tax=Galbitalea sp. SE-J8 TaxID=3054952 RepID=UPI00259CFF3E|nr:oxygenase MpaB family protein [Galbitalea sp. SE-J8]MDM4763376.1 oxygenase MpaB family protein [Galbitalea sp. SE-J8]